MSYLTRSAFIYLFLLLTSTQVFSCFAKEKPDIQLASVYRHNVAITDYWVSEKLDGVRAYWDGRHLISRQGNQFMAPDWFTAGFPDEPMDGELWIARGQFEKVSGIVRQKRAQNNAWRQVKLMIFDLPKSSAPFAKRIEQMHLLVQNSGSPYLHMIAQFKVSGTSELDVKLAEVEAAGGEGLMLHKGTALYQAGRSNDILKVKTYEDAEAVVLEILPGKGQFKGKMGSLLVKNFEGITFRIGSGFKLMDRENPPPPGTIVTYKFYGKTKHNKPRFASFLRIRKLPQVFP